MQLTIDEYSKQFKMSKEMINSRLRAKKLNYLIDDAVTYILVDDISTHIKDKKVEVPQEKKAIVKPKTTVGTVIALYQRENTQLKEKIIQLESKIDRLIDDKEQMLRDERDKIEQLYNKKDEQLKNILELVNTKMMLEHQEQTIHEVETLEKDNISDIKPELGIVELKSHLKTLNLKSYQRKVIKRRFLSVYDNDVRVVHKEGKLYLDFSKYDYSDLLSY
jgi:small-conductance mechanosensitive channel